MFNSEMIVVLWCVPVVLFILMPLSMLCIWACLQLFRKLARKTVQIHQAVKKAQDESYTAGLSSEPVV